MRFLLHIVCLAGSMTLKQIRKKHAQSRALSSPKTSNNYFIVTGDCDVQNNCVSSPNWPNAHGNNEWCFVQLQASGNLTVSNPFDIETCCDVLGVAGTHVWSSSDVPDYVHSGVGIEWQSDGSITNSGWQICINDDGLYATTSSPTTSYCAHDCPHDWIDDGICDVSCSNPQCNYDGNDCDNENNYGECELYDVCDVNLGDYPGMVCHNDGLANEMTCFWSDNNLICGTAGCQNGPTCDLEQLWNFAFTALFITDCHDDVERDDGKFSCECLNAMEDANSGVITNLDCKWDVTHDQTMAEQYEEACPQINWALIIGLVVGGVLFLGSIIGWICYRHCCQQAQQPRVIVQPKRVVQMTPRSAAVQMAPPSAAVQMAPPSAAVQMAPPSAAVLMPPPPPKYSMQVPAYVEPLPPGWIELQDANGRTYYSNSAEQRTTWEDPRGTTIIV